MVPIKFDKIIIENIKPCIDGGRYPIKKIVGEPVKVTADIFKDGHDILAAEIKYRVKGKTCWQKVPMKHICNDEWKGQFKVTCNTRYEYTIEAYTERFLSWRDELEKKSGSIEDLKSELLEGTAIIQVSADLASEEDKTYLYDFINKVKSLKEIEEQKLLITKALSDEMKAVMLKYPDKSLNTEYSNYLDIIVDRLEARYAAWYEMFPRSAGTVEGQYGTFKDVENRLPEIHRMGFNVLYFPPIHPIGRTNRKGPNNSLISGPNDPGCPYAIGNETGGHMAIDPGLGTFEDFEHLRQKAAEYGIEIALDFAINCSPDHPYVKEHPDWFYKRPDGTIKYAENPPKKYEDVYPLNFYCEDRENLWREMRDIILFWAEKGVRIIRVDNPHTKPVAFWEWMIKEVQNQYPDVIFLSEAFTRPKMMKVLAKAGFTQSYTYFTWRNFKDEIIEYFTELTQSEMKDYFTGNLFTNTPDILPTILQEGGRPAFKFRVVMAATLSSVYGIYSGFELCENTPVPGKEEYLNSEKYDFKVWDWDRPGNIKDYIARINTIRRDNPALHYYDNLNFYESENHYILFYGKKTEDLSNIILVALNLDPYQKHESFIYVPIEELQIHPEETYQVHDVLNNERYLWKGSKNFVSLDPHVKPAHIFKIRRWRKRENDFDYFI
jgi:starch synthase (maltosyl-transferring)